MFTSPKRNGSSFALPQPNGCRAAALSCSERRSMMWPAMALSVLGMLLLSLIVGALVLPATAHADTIPTTSNWTVTYPEEGGVLNDDFPAREWADDLKGLQPGDDVFFTVTLRQEFAEDSDWYMSNEVLKTLERGIQAADNPYVNSGYEYELTYTNPAGQTRTIYRSASIGGGEGQDPEGLLEATDALDEFFYLDTLKKGQTAHVDLHILLDGETEQNAYFDTLAQVKMKFAVETTTSSNTTGSKKSPGRGAVQTGDPNDLFPYYVAMLVSGLLLLLLAVDSVRRRRQRAQEASVQRGGHAR